MQDSCKRRAEAPRSWAAVRLYRYSIENINIQAEEGFNDFISKQSGEEGPLGEELGDAFNADIGGLAF